MAPGSSPEFPEKFEGPLIEGHDYLWQNGLMVMTSSYLLRRGFCCENGCRNCPYDRDPLSEPNEPPGKA